MNKSNKFLKIIYFFIITNIVLYSFIVGGSAFINFEFSPNIYDIGRWNEYGRMIYLAIIIVANAFYIESVYSSTKDKEFIK